MLSEVEFRKVLIEEQVLEKFEDDPEFEECLEEALTLILASLRSGRERHGDSFPEAGLLGFANHLQRKGRDQYRHVRGGVDIGATLTDCALDGATFSLLEIAYLVMQIRKASLGSPKVTFEVEK